MSDWKSIDELMTSRAPGSVELVDCDGYRFTPFYRANDVYWRGINEDGVDNSFLHRTPYWKVYTPPTAPVERPQLWWVQENPGEWYILFIAKTEKEIAAEHQTYRPSGIYAPDDKGDVK